MDVIKYNKLDEISSGDEYYYWNKYWNPRHTMSILPS